MTISTLADQVYDKLLGQLFRRDLRPGDLLGRKRIAEEMKVSLIPVSDDVQWLAHEGSLTTRRRKGTLLENRSPTNDTDNTQVVHQTVSRRRRRNSTPRIVMGQRARRER